MRTAARVISSPYLRCVQTVEPVAARLGLVLEQSERLAEGAGAGFVFESLSARDRPWVLCTHGDVVGEVLESLVRQRLIGPDEALMPKGSTWVLEAEDGRLAQATYAAPP